MLNRQGYLSTSTKYDFLKKQYLYLIVTWNRLVQLFDSLANIAVKTVALS